ncbi:MAG: hypothetical protein GY771_03695 [bacterium]|nr:hypothetical protein [bacterium]
MCVNREEEEISADETEGIEYQIQTYSEEGQLLSTAYFEGKIPVEKLFGCHKSVFTYDDSGFQNSISEFDKDGKPALDWFGVSCVEYKRDDKGNIISESYYGMEDEPVFANEAYMGCYVDAETGTHRIDYTYDENGNRTSISYFGIYGQPVIGKGGKTVYYDIDENIVEPQKTAKVQSKITKTN